MNYEKYNNALEKARVRYNEIKDTGCREEEFLLELFPELAESEDDERIRKVLIDYFNRYKEQEECGVKTFYGIPTDNILAWLEKQSNKSNIFEWHSVSEEPEEMKELFCEWESDDATWHDVAFYDEESHTFRHAKKPINVTKWVYVDELLEKQGEKKAIMNVPTREVILSIWDLGNEWKELTNGSISTEYGTQLDYIQKHWHESEYYLREKQGEKKSADKVEPKFHEGDWIIDKQGIVHQIEKVIENVTNNTFAYDLVGGGYFNEEVKSCRLWTIQDAKPGDVLVASDGSIFLFAGVVDCACKYYVALTACNDVKINKEADGGYWETSRAVHPATKEQRDTLLKVMTDAGYTFDFEKKELRKIENEIEIPFGAKDSKLQEVTYFIPKGFHAEIDDDTVVIKKGEQSPAWSEEDEKVIHCLEYTVKHFYEDEDTIKWCCDWLKSLRPQNTWRPSDAQMASITCAVRKMKESACYDSELVSLFNDLKKLK